jgi:hypothetical protein
MLLRRLPAASRKCCLELSKHSRGLALALDPVLPGIALVPGFPGMSLPAFERGLLMSSGIGLVVFFLRVFPDLDVEFWRFIFAQW